MYGRNYYRPDQYVSKSMMEKRALPYIQGELLRLHTNNAQMLTDESELEFLKVAIIVNFDNENECLVVCLRLLFEDSSQHVTPVQLPLVSHSII